MKNPLAPHITDIMTAVDTQLKSEGFDKSALRRAKSHLESAYHCLNGAMAYDGPISPQTAGINVQQPIAGMPGLSRPQAGPSVCVCPIGSRDRTCPATIHN